MTEIPLELLPRLCPFCGERTIIGHGRRLKQAHDERHQQIWIRRGRVVPARRPLRCCPTGRRRQGTTASTAGNKRGSCCARRTPIGSDPFPTSPTRRDRQTRLPCDGGRNALLHLGTLLASKALADYRLQRLHSTHHPCLGLDCDPPYSAVGGEQSVSRQAIDELKQQIPLLDYLEAHHWRPLRRLSRGRWMGLCPLHNDHKPSFLVDPSKNLFYCYGCGRGGDVIRFAELYHQVKFPQALGLLRQWRGWAPLLHEAASFYRMQLHRHGEARCLSAPTRTPLAGTDRAHADRLRAWRLPARLADAVGLPAPGSASSRAGHRRRLRHLHAIALCSRWKAISMAAASQLRRRLTGFCRAPKAACMCGSKSGNTRK